MAPIRVGIIGLSAAGGSWGATAHLPYLKESSKYTITGVCNSSTASSQAAIDAYELMPHAKAYGSIADMASSPDVDLVVCSVRVDRHYEAMKPILEAGKDCYVEWPLASNLEQATELLQLAEQKGVRTIIGLQSRMSPALSRIQELLHKDKAIGRILGSRITLAGMIGGAQTTEAQEYLNFVELGGNMLVIPFGHLYDAVSYTLGELQNVSSTLSIQHPDLPVMSQDGSQVLRTIRRTAADRVAMSGLLANGVQSSAAVYGGLPFKDEPALVWQIEGDKGILEVSGDSAFAISMSGNLKIRLHVFETGEVRDIEFTENKPGPPGNIGRLYEAYADAQYYPDWKAAVERHAWVDAIYKSDETGKRVSYVE